MISAASYDALGNVAATINGTVYTVPDDPGNRHRQELTAWVAAGGVIAPYVAPPAPIPSSVSPYQARRALNAAGLRSAVEAAVAAAPYEVQDAWEYALVVERNSPMIDALASSLGLTETQLDDLFIVAASYV